MDIKEQFNLVSEQYDGARRIFIPCFDSFYDRTTQYLLRTWLKPKKILDLGAGTGLLDAFYLKYCPKAEYHLVDVADKMLDVAKKRFTGLENICYEVNDYAKDYHYDGFDTVVSALSIHHLENDNKQQLFNSIYANLNSGGVFVNYDQFCFEDKDISRKTDEYWCSLIENSSLSKDEIQRWKERWKLDREVSVKEELSMLKQAGFSTVECVFYELKFGVIVCTKN
ncbi:MAG: methyltransferase domain-containing protein [Succinivibrio sp.]